MQSTRPHSGGASARARLAARHWAVILCAAAACLAAAPAVAASRANLVGSAIPLDGVIQLDPPEGGPPGAIWRHKPISLLSSFEVRFNFTLAAGTRPQADGVALVIQTDGTRAIGGGGGDVGYGGLHGVASVVQTYVNNRVGLNLDSNPYNTKAAPVDLGAAQLIEGVEVVKYDVVAHTLSMRGHLVVDGVKYDVHDAKAVDLAALLGSDTATIGVTGGTGSLSADQRVVDWRFMYLP
jgi:hypothetical protein